MKNLIMNPRRLPGPSGGPQYFSGTGCTYDNFTLRGYRTSSLTISGNCGMAATDVYEPAIDTFGKRMICFGYCIRAIEAENVALVANFFDFCGCLIDSCRFSIASRITEQFSEQFGCFPIPENAQTARLSMEFSGTITACTFFAPTAFFR